MGGEGVFSARKHVGSNNRLTTPCIAGSSLRSRRNKMPLTTLNPRPLITRQGPNFETSKGRPGTGTQAALEPTAAASQLLGASQAAEVLGNRAPDHWGCAFGALDLFGSGFRA